MRVRIVKEKNSIRFICNNESYSLIRKIVLNFCEIQLISQNPLIDERISEISGKPGINNNDGLPPRCGNEIQLFLRDSGLNPEKVLNEIKSIISMDVDIEILE